MDDAKKYRHKLIGWLIGWIVIGIMVFGVVILYIRAGNYEISTLLLAVWVIFYVEYASLKTKVEILEELKKEKSDNLNK